ncbi:MAG: GNAT family N-acetyltransferase [Gallionellaceae bacterium]|nr:GNAT family N-acetyltransferase [Gallionellaceae bacterium]
MNFTIHPVTWHDAEPMLRAVREAVFIREQSVLVELEWDGLDETSHHVLALSSTGQAIGCGRILPNAHIGRIAVMPEWRGKKVGTAILEGLLAYASSRHYPEVDLDAQVQALPFYRNFGFIEEGEDFMDAGIPHRKLRMKL